MRILSRFVSPLFLALFLTQFTSCSVSTFEPKILDLVGYDDMEVRDSILFVISPVGQVEAWDVSRRTAPEVIGESSIDCNPLFGVCWASYFYMACSSEIAIFDVSSPDSVVRSSGILTTVSVAMQLEGKYLYVATDDSSLLIIDVSDQNSPVIVSTTAFDFPLTALSNIYRNTLFVGTAEPSIEIISIEDRSIPDIVGSYDIDIAAVCIDVRTTAGILLAATRTDGNLEIFDLGWFGENLLAAESIEYLGQTYLKAFFLDNASIFQHLLLFTDSDLEIQTFDEYTGYQYFTPQSTINLQQDSSYVSVVGSGGILYSNPDSATDIWTASGRTATLHVAVRNELDDPLFSVGSFQTSVEAAVILLDERHFVDSPSSPSDTVATRIDSESVFIEWTDNSVSETGFLVERGYLTGTSWDVVGEPLKNVSVWTDEQAHESSGYRYRVAAVSDAGTSEYDSVVTVPGS